MVQTISRIEREFEASHGLTMETTDLRDAVSVTISSKAKVRPYLRINVQMGDAAKAASVALWAWNESRPDDAVMSDMELEQWAGWHRDLGHPMPADEPVGDGEEPCDNGESDPMRPGDGAGCSKYRVESLGWAAGAACDREGMIAVGRAEVLTGQLAEANDNLLGLSEQIEELQEDRIREVSVAGRYRSVAVAALATMKASENGGEAVSKGECEWVASELGKADAMMGELVGLTAGDE